MSLLADLLAKNKSDEPVGDKDIPPTLTQTFSAPLAERSMKSRYVVISLVAGTLVIAGVVATTQFKRLTALISPKPVVVQAPRVVEQPKQAPVTAVKEPEQPATQVAVAVPQVAADKASAEVPSGTNVTQAADEDVTKSHKSTRKKKANTRKPASYRRSSFTPAEPQILPIRPKRLDITVAPRPGTVPIPAVDAVKRDALLYAAKYAESNSDWRTALHKYRSALDVDPENFRIMNNIAACLNNLGKYDEGAREARRALEKSPSYVPAMINAAIAYSSTGNSMEALLLFTDASSVDPGNKNLTINLGVMQERAGKLDEALVTYHQLADAGDPHAIAGIARVYERRGYKNEAARMYRKIQKMPEADSVLKKEIKERLARLGE